MAASSYQQHRSRPGLGSRNGGQHGCGSVALLVVLFLAGGGRAELRVVGYKTRCRWRKPGAEVGTSSFLPAGRRSLCCNRICRIDSLLSAAGPRRSLLAALLRVGSGCGGRNLENGDKTKTCAEAGPAAVCGTLYSRPLDGYPHRPLTPGTRQAIPCFISRLLSGLVRAINCPPELTGEIVTTKSAPFISPNSHLRCSALVRSREGQCCVGQM